MLAAIQFRPTRGRREANLAALAGLVQRAGVAGARLVVLPEMAATGYRFGRREDVAAVAEPWPDGPTALALAPLARRFGIHIVVGFPEAAPDGRLYNAAGVLLPDGGTLPAYRKRLLYTDDEHWAAPGDRPFPVFDSPVGRVTVGVCMDVNGDEFTRHVRATRPAVVAFPTNWVDEGAPWIHGYWAMRLGMLDGTWTGTLVAADRWGDEDGVRFWGRSAIIRAGHVVAWAGAEGDGVILAEGIRQPPG